MPARIPALFSGRDSFRQMRSIYQDSRRRFGRTTTFCSITLNCAPQKFGVSQGYSL
jgi:hypothetical protein